MQADPASPRPRGAIARGRRPPSEKPSHLDAAPSPHMKASEAVMRSLRADIITGLLPSGGRLPTEKELAKLFGVSQSTVREAIRGLEAVGLLQSRHGSGVYVSSNASEFVSNALEALLQMQRAHILEVVAVRRALGLYSAGLACDHATEKDLETIEAALGRAEAGGDARKIMAGITDFQVAISEAGHNPLLAAVESVLIRILMQFQLMAHGERSNKWWSAYIGQFTSHRHRLLEALRRRDRDAVISEWEAYLRNQQERFADDPLLSGITLSDQLALETLYEANNGTGLAQ